MLHVRVTVRHTWCWFFRSFVRSFINAHTCINTTPLLCDPRLRSIHVRSYTTIRTCIVCMHVSTWIQSTDRSIHAPSETRSWSGYLPFCSPVRARSWTPFAQYTQTHREQSHSSASRWNRLTPTFTWDAKEASNQWGIKSTTHPTTVARTFASVSFDTVPKQDVWATYMLNVYACHMYVRIRTSESIFAPTLCARAEHLGTRI